MYFSSKSYTVLLKLHFVEVTHTGHIWHKGYGAQSSRKYLTGVNDNKTCPVRKLNQRVFGLPKNV